MSREKGGKGRREREEEVYMCEEQDKVEEEGRRGKRERERRGADGRREGQSGVCEKGVPPGNYQE